MLNMPRNEPDPPRVTTWLISTRFTPGTVMNTPTRYTARMNNVNKIRRRSSGTLPMFAMEPATWTYLLPGQRRMGSAGDLDRAARLLDLFLRGGRGAIRLDRELLGDLTLAEDLDVLDELGDQALGAKRVEIDGGAGIEHALERREGKGREGGRHDRGRQRSPFCAGRVKDRSTWQAPSQTSVRSRSFAAGSCSRCS